MLQHRRYLLFRGIPLSRNGLLDFSRRILKYRQVHGDGRSNGNSLRTTQFEHGLNILSKKRRFNGHDLRLKRTDNPLQALMDVPQLLVMILKLL